MSTNLPNLAAFAALPTKYKSHVLFYVSTLRDYFRLERGNTDAPDGITRIAYGGGGNFVRLEIAAPEWSYQTTYWVNPLTGRDENDGTQRTQGAGFVGPIQTYAELFRRLSRVVAPRVTMTVNQENDCPENLFFTADPIFGGEFIWQGLPIAQTSATVTTATNLVPGTSTPGSGTPTAVVANWTPAAEMQRLVQDLATGRYAWVAKDQNGIVAGQARLSPWTDINLTQPTNVVTIGNAANGDSLQTYTLPKVASVDLKVLSSTAASPSSAKVVVNFLALEGAVGSNIRTRIVSLGQQPIFQNCAFSANLPRLEGGSMSFNNCAFTGGGGTILGNDLWTFATFNAGYVPISLTLNRKSVLTLQSHVLFQGPGAALTLDGGSNVAAVDACFCDLANQISLYHRSSLRIANTLWGTGNTTPAEGVYADVNCDIDVGFSAVPSLTGNTSDFSLGGNAQGYAWDDAAHAFTATKRAYSWINLTTAVAGGGFGNRINDPATGCRVGITAII